MVPKGQRITAGFVCIFPGLRQNISRPRCWRLLKCGATSCTKHGKGSPGRSQRKGNDNHALWCLSVLFEHLGAVSGLELATEYIYIYSGSISCPYDCQQDRESLLFSGHSKLALSLSPFPSPSDQVSKHYWTVFAAKEIWMWIHHNLSEDKLWQWATD